MVTGRQKPKALIDGVKSVANVRSDRHNAHLQYFRLTDEVVRPMKRVDQG